MNREEVPSTDQPANSERHAKAGRNLVAVACLVVVAICSLLALLLIMAGGVKWWTAALFACAIMPAVFWALWVSCLLIVTRRTPLPASVRLRGVLLILQDILIIVFVAFLFFPPNWLSEDAQLGMMLLVPIAAVYCAIQAIRRTVRHDPKATATCPERSGLMKSNEEA
ncbi:MAG: hypothetical protein FJ271_07505 [Planctomycetes bacterium]|nr:hypothetical protein [Planctomycetota bacterium]